MPGVADSPLMSPWRLAGPHAGRDEPGFGCAHIADGAGLTAWTLRMAMVAWILHGMA